MKTPPIFTKQQYRKWQIDKRMKKKSNKIIAAAIITVAAVSFFLFRK